MSNVFDAAFEERLFAPETEVYDPEGIHHEFSQGLHGRKIDFGNIEEGSDFYCQWVDVTVRHTLSLYSKELLGRAVLIGIAYGTNPLARDTAEALDCGTVALETYKDENGKVALTPEAIELLQSINPLLALAMEDVGTRGNNSMRTVLSTHFNRPPGLQAIEVNHTVVRGVLDRLLSLGIVYNSLITRLMKDLEPKKCRESGPCAEGWKLVPYTKPTPTTSGVV